MLNSFISSKKHIISKFNEKFGNHFRKEIMKHGCTDENLANKLIPENIFSNDTINKDALEIFRKFEENHLSTSQGGN